MTVPVSVVILTYNEEPNLPYALDSIKDWAGQIIVVDSYSTDRTLEIARAYGCDIYQNGFVNCCVQRNWALQVPQYKYDWVMYIDADEQVPPELRDEIQSVLSAVSDDIAGFMMRRRQMFLGRWIRHGGCYLWLLRLFRRACCRFVESHAGGEYPVVRGQVGRLKRDIIHCNQKPFALWIQRHNAESTNLALQMFKRGVVISKGPGLKENERIEGPVRTFLNYKIYSRIPLFLKPFAKLVVIYFFRGGFLDGWQGFAYHFVNAFVMPFLLAVKYRELGRSQAAIRYAEQSKWR